jgi:hypothetical protein
MEQFFAGYLGQFSDTQIYTIGFPLGWGPAWRFQGYDMPNPCRAGSLDACNRVLDNHAISWKIICTR